MDFEVMFNYNSFAEMGCEIVLSYLISNYLNTLLLVNHEEKNFTDNEG